MKKEDRLMLPSRELKEINLSCCAYLIAAAVIVVLMIMGTSWAGDYDMNPGQTGAIYKSTTNDSVRGYGYIMEYKKINTNNLSLLEYSHGSGSMDYSDVASSEQKTDTSGMNYVSYLDYTTEKWELYYLNGDSVICYNKQYDNTYSPVTFTFGDGWYSSHPITYNSFLKDKTEAKSYQEGISMDRQVEYARGLKGDIAVDINCTGGTLTNIGTGSLSMKLDDNMIQGTMHVGELLTPTLKNYGYLRDMKVQGEKVPIIDTDVTYVGDFGVQKEMKIEVPKYGPMLATDWLPCCSGGFFDVLNWDTEHAGQRGIFDCTCYNMSLSNYKPAWNGTTAQFPESIYGSKP